MKVFKFGGASVKNADGVRNLQHIVAQECGDLVVVVSAMGKTTNALEAILEDTINGNTQGVTDKWNALLDYHYAIIQDLGLDDVYKDQLRQWVSQTMPKSGVGYSYERLYDEVVSMGERMSTMIVTTYLQQCGMLAVLWDMIRLLRTDDTYREAVVDMETSARQVQEAWEALQGHRLVVAQGFIGGTREGHPTTLGREGSDYTAAIMGNLLNAESVTIWKDVPGILNADPRLVDGTTKIDELSYIEAVELAYSGAQVIHPKTIRPLENKSIPLYVKPFGDPKAPGSVIKRDANAVTVPVYIWRKNQVLITMRAKDFSFVLEESLSHIFSIIHKNRLRVSLIQSSAITISVCVDNTRYVQKAIQELQADYKVTWNDNLSLLTIRGTTPAILQHEQVGRDILLSQTTRRTARLVIKETNLIP